MREIEIKKPRLAESPEVVGSEFKILSIIRQIGLLLQTICLPWRFKYISFKDKPKPLGLIIIVKLNAIIIPVSAIKTN